MPPLNSSCVIAQLIGSGTKREVHSSSASTGLWCQQARADACGTHGSAIVASAFVMRHHDSDRLARYPSTDIRGIEATQHRGHVPGGRLAVTPKRDRGISGGGNARSRR
jgi:hypothetical protein